MNKWLYASLCWIWLLTHGPPTRYVKLRVAHAPGMPGTFSPPPISKETAGYRSRYASRHVRDARAVMHVGIANPRRRGNVPGIPGACATRNFTYLARGPWPNFDGGSTKPPLKLKHSWVITHDCWTWMCSFIHALIKCKKSEKCETRLIVCGIRQHTYQNACTLIKVFNIFQSPTKWQTSRRWHLWMQLYERWILF